MLHTTRSLLLAMGVLLTTTVRPQCTETAQNKVLLVGDSWAFFMGVDQTINEVLAKWGHSGYRYYTNLTLAENGAETDDFLGMDKQAEITDRLLNDPGIKVVHLSIGGNDVLGDCNVSFTPEQTDSLRQALFYRLQHVITFILGVRPDIHVLWSGYMYPNFEEVIEDLAPLQTIHPFYGTWQDMGFPTFIQLNTILNDFSALLEGYADTTDRVSFVSATGLMQHAFGQNTTLGVPPGGSYPPSTAPLPFGFVDYPSPKSSMRNYGLTRDCFHLSASGYREMVELHARKFYHKFLMDDQYLISSGSQDGSVSSQGAVSSTLQLGTAGTEQFATVLTFATTDMQQAIVDGASIFLRRTGLTGDDPLSSTLQVKVKSGAFGTAFEVEAVDYFASPDASGSACRFGSNGGNGHWIRLDLPTELLPYLSQTAATQFILSAPGFTQGVMTFNDASDPELAPVLNLRFGELVTATGPVPNDERHEVFPNPTDGPLHLNVTGEQVLDVQVFDLLGQLVLHRHAPGALVDLSALPAGQYLIHLRTTSGSSVQRVARW
ncbi:MAG: T9SS type A sorting domain-containing protein [Flavobacteriales bacterium]